MVEPRTIDNLGIETSIRYATDQTILEKTIIQEASRISTQAEVDIYTPFYQSEFDFIFETKKRHQQWATFFSPPGYLAQRMRIFRHQVIPSLGTEEFQQTQMQKIKDLRNQNKKKRQKTKGKSQNVVYAWEDEREEEEEEKESKTLLDLIQYITSLDSLLGVINARRSQYSKG